MANETADYKEGVSLPTTAATAGSPAAYIDGNFETIADNLEGKTAQLSTLSTAVATETAARIAADAQLQTAIDTIELTPGPQGPQGIQGIQGVKGDKGDKGDPGDPASNLVTSVNEQTGDVFITATGIGAATTTALDNEAAARELADDDLTDLINNGLSGKVSNADLTAALTDKVDVIAFTDFQSETLTALDTKASTTDTDALQAAIDGVNSELDTTQSTLSAHAANTSNPHGVTKAQVGLSNVANVDTTNAANITSGTLNVARIPSLSYLPLAGGTLTGGLSGTSLSLSGGLTASSLTSNGDVTLPDGGAYVGKYGPNGWTALYSRSEEDAETLSLYVRDTEAVVVSSAGLSAVSIGGDYLDVTNADVGSTLNTYNLNAYGPSDLGGNVNVGGNLTFDGSSRLLDWGMYYGSPAMFLYNGGTGGSYGMGIQPSELQQFIPNGAHYSWNFGGSLNASGTNESMRLSPNNLSVELGQSGAIKLGNSGWHNGFNQVVNGCYFFQINSFFNGGNFQRDRAGGCSMIQADQNGIALSYGGSGAAGAAVTYDYGFFYTNKTVAIGKGYNAASQTLEVCSETNYQLRLGHTTGGVNSYDVGRNATDGHLYFTGNQSGYIGFRFNGPIITPSAPPASSSATGVTGQQAWDSNYIYVCTATNTWKRAALSTW